jgi:two-component system cell cycle sensor histidine kinase/response regulator CckA
MSDTMEGASSGEQSRSVAILVVDDDALIRLTLSDYLQDQGFKVLEAATGDEALAIMAAPGFLVDLVFTDVMMPGLTDGLALANWIGENQPEIPVIVTSGDKDKVAGAKEAGDSFHFVPKPYDLEELATQIRRTLDKRSTAS